MKPFMDIPDSMPDNADDEVFKNEFFKRFTLRKAPAPLQLTGNITRDYLFPSFFGEVTCAQLIFFCSYRKAESLVAGDLHPKIKPVRISKGRSIIIFSCYEYKKVMNIRPYNEIAAVIPVMVNTSFRPPLLPMIMKFSRFGYHIAAMPVTSYENQIRGNKIWGMPKVTRRIDIDREGDLIVVSAFEESGGSYLTLRIPVDGKATDFDETSFLYTRLDGRLIQSTTCFRGTFNVNKNTGLLFKKGGRPDINYIEIGNSGSAGILRDLEIEETPFQTRYSDNLASSLDLHNEKVPGWFDKLNR